MTWFAAHAVIYLKCLDGSQDSYLVWENVYLIEAGGRSEAHERAQQRALQEAHAHNDSGMLGGQPGSDADTTWNGRPARWTFAGVRKVVDVFHLSSEDVLRSGDELTYSALEFARESDLLAFAEGADMSVQYQDRLSEPEGTPRW